MNRHPTNALELLAQLAPREVLERAYELAREIERDEYVKNYIARRALAVAAVGIATTVAFGAGTFILLRRLFPLLPLFDPWQKAAVGLPALLIWGGATVLVMYAFLASLQRAALAQRARERSSG